MPLSCPSRLLATALFAVLLQPVLPVLAAPDSCSGGSPYVCPEWLPSQAEVSKAVQAYYRMLSKKGALQLRVGPMVRTSTSSISCAALGRSVDSNFVCGGEVTFRDVLGRKQSVQFSDTLRRTESGGLAFFAFGDWIEPET